MQADLVQSQIFSQKTQSFLHFFAQDWVENVKAGPI